METDEFKSLWQHYNVHCVWPDQIYEKLCVTALSKNDALKDPKVVKAINAGVYPYKVIGPLGQKPSTSKQKLAQRYGYLMGSIKSAKLTFKNAFLKDPISRAVSEKLNRAISLTESQFAKLERDLRDCFKLAGLKIK